MLLIIFTDTSRKAASENVIFHQLVKIQITISLKLKELFTPFLARTESSSSKTKKRVSQLKFKQNNGFTQSCPLKLYPGMHEYSGVNIANCKNCFN